MAYLPFRLSGRRSVALEMRLADAAWRADWRRWPAFVRYASGVMLESIGVPLPWSQQEVRLGLFNTRVSERFAIEAEVCAHVVLWRTKLGRCPAALSRDELRAMSSWVAVAVPALTAHGLLDPLAEVLAAHACVRGAFVAHVWQPLLDAQRGDGALPARVGDDTKSFAGLYHTTLAAVLAASLVTEQG